MHYASPLYDLQASLWSPDPRSWVALLAYIFRVLAFITLAPILFLTLADVAAYVVARTVGMQMDVDSTMPADTKIVLDSPTNALHELPNADGDSLPGSNRPSQITIPPLPEDFRLPSRQHFTTPGEGNFALSGLFSPPESRSTSPGITMVTKRGRAPGLGLEGPMGPISESSSAITEDIHESENESGEGESLWVKVDTVPEAGSSSSSLKDSDVLRQRRGGKSGASP